MTQSDPHSADTNGQQLGLTIIFQYDRCYPCGVRLDADASKTPFKLGLSSITVDISLSIDMVSSLQLQSWLGSLTEDD